MSLNIIPPRKPRLLNIKYCEAWNQYKEDFVYIGRPSEWSNPWVMTKGSLNSRAKVIEKYRKWLCGEAFLDLLQPERRFIIDNIGYLEDKVLLCYCKPLSCHGDVLLELLDEHLIRKKEKLDLAKSQPVEYNN